MVINTRLFGKTGPAVTQVGLGGEGVLRTYGPGHEAQSVIEEAAAQGIAYFDCAKAYAGSEGYYGSFWRKHSELRSRIFGPANPPLGMRWEQKPICSKH